MRLTVVVDAAVFGGAEHLVGLLLPRLPASVRPTLLVSEPVPPPLVAAAAQSGTEVRRFRAPRGKADVLRLAALVRQLARTRPDVIHVNMATAANNRHALAVAVRLRSGVVPVVHSLVPVTSRPQQRHLNRTWRRVPVSVSTSQAVAAQLVSDIGLDPDRLRVIRPGVPVRAPGLPRPPDEPLHVVSVGRLSREKGHDVLVAALRRLLEGGARVRATLVGDGPERAALERAAAGLPIAFTGHVSDVNAVLDTADVFCLPSRNEAIGMALLEAMMAGIACVASDVGDVATLAPDIAVVPAGDVAALADALSALARSPADREALGAAAHRRASADFDVDSMTAGLVSVYEVAVGAPHGRSS